MGYHKRFITQDQIISSIGSLDILLSAEALFVDDKCEKFVDDYFNDPQLSDKIKYADNVELNKILESYGLK